MARYQVILAYDGTDFQGFQRQPSIRTVQSVFEQALQTVGRQDVAVLAAGRTDTGVHATGQVVAFDLEWRHSPEDLTSALNANLPPDVVVRASHEVRPDFHPRFSALSRRYRYRLFCDPLRDPLRERYAWRISTDISMPLLEQAAGQIIGEHDFSGFGTPSKPGGSTFRRVFSAAWSEEGQELVFDISGNGFLYRMVRRLVYYQIEIGQGVRAASDLREQLDGRTHNLVQGLAPASGLCLIEVAYPEETRVRGPLSTNEITGANARTEWQD
jgi:tRNA pseudouridine38-40 synthase